jgi:CBS domain containing-hemolysin-like protein
VEYDENELVLPSNPAGINLGMIWVVVNVLMSKMNLLLAILRNILLVTVLISYFCIQIYGEMIYQNLTAIYSSTCLMLMIHWLCSPGETCS